MRLRLLATVTLIVVAACSGEPPAVITLDTTTTLLPASRPATSTSAATTTTGATTASIAETTTTTLPDGIALTFAQPGTPEAEVEIALHLAAAGYDIATEEPVDPAHPLFVSTHAEPLLSIVQANIQILIDEGWATRPGVGNLAADYVTSIVIADDGLSATVIDCVLDDGVVYDIATGEILNDEILTATVRMVFVNESNQWLLSRSVALDEVEGIGGCLELDS